jgi:hypothetical protein
MKRMSCCTQQVSLSNTAACRLALLSQPCHLARCDKNSLVSNQWLLGNDARTSCTQPTPDNTLLPFSPVFDLGPSHASLPQVHVPARHLGGPCHPQGRG